MENISNSIRQTCRFRRVWTTLLFCVASLGSTGLLKSQSWAQEEYGDNSTTPLRVENATGVDILRAAANCTGGGSLEVDWSGAIPLDSPILVASGMVLSIMGEDTLAEVSAVSQTRMFEVSPGGKLTLIHLKLSGGTEAGGGAIHSKSAALTLDGCAFHGNVAIDGDGGAVWAEGGNVTILGGEFFGNKATGNGGAVALAGVSNLAVLEGSIFDGNTALEGGALYCNGVAESGLARCSLDATQFTSNIATAEGEGPFFLDFSEEVEGGGAVAFFNATADITDSVFSGNHANYSGGALLGGTGTDITVNGCKFDGNTAEVFGGAIAAASIILGGNTQLTSNNVSSSDDREIPGDTRAILNGGAVSATA